MKIKLCTFCTLLLLYSIQSYGQMEVAQKITYNLDKSVIFPVKRSIIWNLFKNTSSWDKFSNDFIKSIKNTSSTQDSSRQIIFENGFIREDFFTQFDMINRMMVFKSNYHTNSIKENFIVIFVEALDENKCKLNYKIKLEGNTNSNEYKKIMELLQNEFNAYTIGINKLIKLIK